MNSAVKILRCEGILGRDPLGGIASVNGKEIGFMILNRDFVTHEVDEEGMEVELTSTEREELIKSISEFVRRQWMPPYAVL